MYLFLVQSGAYQIVDTLLSTHQINVDYSDIDGFTGLEIAVDRGDVEMVRVLIKHGARVEYQRLAALALARGEEGKEIANLILLEAKRRENENV